MKIVIDYVRLKVLQKRSNSSLFGQESEDYRNITESKYKRELTKRPLEVNVINNVRHKYVKPFTKFSNKVGRGAI